MSGEMVQQKPTWSVC